MDARWSVSCVLRTFNEEALVGRCLDSLAAQQGAEVEVIVVDSGSTDRTLEIVEGRIAKLLHVPTSDLKSFDYSKPLNLGIEAASGDLIIVLSAHAIPTDDRWLERMSSHFEDERVAGVYSRQVPWPDANWDEVLRIEKSFGPDSKVYEQGAEVECFSNAASLLRRSAWEERRFTLPAGEDLDWARWMVSEGRRIVYEAEAKTYHSHAESPRDVARRVINLERSSDVAQARGRSVLRTAREAASWIWRDSRQVLRLDKGLVDKLGCLRVVVARGFWYVVEFAGAR